MASACVNNIGMSPEKNFLDCSTAKYPSCGWLSPRISFSREFPDEEASKVTGAIPSAASENAAMEKPEESNRNVSGRDFVDFEFRLEDPVTMLPADELFFDGKLVPLQLSTIRHSMTAVPSLADVKLPDTPKLRRTNEISVTDPYLFSPKAPRCSSRWKELLGLKKISQNTSARCEESKTMPSLSSNNNNKNTTRSLKHFLQRSSKSSLNASIDSSLSLPLLKDSENESVSISSRLSLSSSSSSSGHEHDDLPRLSLDSDKPSMSRNANHSSRKHSRVRVVNAPVTRVGRSTMLSAPEATISVRGVSVDSPRMNSSGKIVFQSLERSSSSPSIFNGGPRYKYRGMERSYSTNVRVTPVLNVPICSLRGSSKSGVFGFPLFSSQQIKGGGNKGQSHSRNRTDRT